MPDFFLALEFGLGDQHLTREEFLARFKQEFAKPLRSKHSHWAYQLTQVFLEVVKNFYDHSDKRCRLLVIIDRNEVTWEASDSGPGDPEGRSIQELSARALHDRAKYENSPPDGNCGLGLGLIASGLDAMRLCDDVQESLWHLSTKGKFEYCGRIILKE